MAHHETPLVLVLRAYEKFTHDELVLFLKVRNLPTIGADKDLASRLAHHDLHTYHFSTSLDIKEPALEDESRTQSLISSPPTTNCPPQQFKTHDLPIDIIAEIMERVGDWELAKAIRVPTSLVKPLEWNHASRMDYAAIPGFVSLLRTVNPRKEPLTKLGATLILRLGYVTVLEYLLTQQHSLFRTVFKDDFVPIKASRHGRTKILDWWKHSFEYRRNLLSPPTRTSIAEAIDGASRNGQVISLDWWLGSGLPLVYTEGALEYASGRNQITVLEWWKRQHKTHSLPLKIGRVMDMACINGHVQVLEWWASSQLEFKYDRNAMYLASCNGRIEVLDWWLNSGLQLAFDQDVLTGATRHNRANVLEWWDKCGMPIQYRMCDIEEALEDAIGGGEAARAWWERKGADFNEGDKEWMKLRYLN